jgi:two-component system sensor histidine kinase ChiS
VPPTPLPHHPPERSLLGRVAILTAAAVLLVAMATTLVGVQLAALAARDGIERRASLLAVMTSARLAEVPPAQWSLLTERLTARVGAIVTVVSPRGFAIAGAHESPIAPGDALLATEHPRGEVSYSDQSYFVAGEPLSGPGAAPQRVLVAMPLAASRAQVPQLLLGLFGVLAVIGALGVASAFVVARDIVTDVRAIARRALSMTTGEAAAVEPLPVRALDEVGELVESFNRLQRRVADELETHKAALARLEDAERRKEALIATLRHELRTPLNSIIGFADLLLSGVDGDLTELQREDVDVVARSGRNLLQLVDDVLDLSAIASGRFSIETRPCDLVAIAREVAREAAGSARRKNVSLEVDGVPNALVEGDPLSLRRAITNLVQNAIDYAGGRVHVEVQVDGRTATVAVLDNGPGIRSQDLKRLFKPFERGRSVEAARAGAGLGLAITVALLELHGGRLAAESEVGKGSKFIATLPLRPTALEQAGFA